MAETGKCSGGRRRRHTKKAKKHTRRRRTVRGGMFASAAGPIAGATGQPAGMEYGGVLVSGTAPVANTGQAAGLTGGRRRRSRRHRSRHRMRGGDASTDTGGEGRGGVSAGFGGEAVGFNAPGGAVHYATSTRA